MDTEFLIQKHEERITDVEKNFHMLDKSTAVLSSQVLSLANHIVKLTTSIELATEKMNSMIPTVKKEKEKERDADKWNHYVKTLLLSAIVGVAAAIITDIVLARIRGH